MSVTFDINNISLEDLNDLERMLLISFKFEYKDKNLSWQFEKPYEILFDYFKLLSNKIPNISPLPLLSKYNFRDPNVAEQIKQNIIQYLSDLLKRKEVLKFSSFQRLFEFPDSITEKIITIDTLSNINDNNIIDYCFYDPFLFISSGNPNSSRALSFLFSYFDTKGSLISYKLNNSGAYGEKRLIENFKKDSDNYITKIEHIKHFLFCGYSDGCVDIFNINEKKIDFYIYSKIQSEKNALSINDSYKIANIFYNKEKGFVYIFYEKDRKVSLYEINTNNHIKDIELVDNPIKFSYITFEINIIFLIDSYGTFWIFKLKQEDNSVKLLQASYIKLYDISSAEIYHEQNNDQTLNVFLGKNDKIYLYQYSSINNNFTLKLRCDVKFKINSIIYSKLNKCLFFGCDNGTVQIWKDTTKTPEYIIDSGYDKINKLFFDEKNKYLFISEDKSIKILEINLDDILLGENKEEDPIKDNIINISETSKEERKNIFEKNMILIGKAHQTPFRSDKKDKKNNEEDKKEEDKKEENIIEIKNDKGEINEDKETEIQTNSEENEYKYEVRSIGSLDGWDEW